MPHKFLISGGGTGGHVFPAIAIANALKVEEPDAEFLFVGALGKMEMEKVPAAGFKIIGLNITGIKRSLSWSNLKFPYRLISSLIKARSIIRAFKPDVVIGVGGFASGPVLRMATNMGVPALIQEQNSFAGITNRWVSKSIDKACVAYEGMDKFFPKDRIVITGNPVRKEVVDIQGKRERALASFGFDPTKKVLLIVGGSLGARSINRALSTDVERLLDKNIQVIWQTGKLFKTETEALKNKFSDRPLVITEFIHAMDEAYAAADVVISRAGAIAVSELCLVGKPTVLVPFPFAAEDHQTKNALSLVHTDAAFMITDRDVQQDLVDIALKILEDEGLQSKLAQNIVKHAKPEAAQHIAKEVLKLTVR